MMTCFEALASVCPNVQNWTIDGKMLDQHDRLSDLSAPEVKAKSGLNWHDVL